MSTNSSLMRQSAAKRITNISGHIFKHRRTATNDIIGPLTDGHKLVTETEEMAKLVNNQFMSVFSDNSTPTQSNNSETASDEFCREEQHPS